METDTVPEITSPEWQDFVISSFTTEELYKGKHPTVNGLRRVVELLLGPIIQGKVRTVDVSYQETNSCNGFRTTVEYEVTINNNGQNLIFSSVADAGPDNSDPVYRKFPAALAETRAESRALRKALKLQVAAAEELSKVAEADNKEPLTKSQSTLITTLLHRLKIDKVKFEEVYGCIKDMTKAEGIEVIQNLNKFQQDGVPEEIRS